MLSGLGAALFALVVAAAVSTAVGTRAVPLSRVVDSLFHFDPHNVDHLAIWELRLPRTVLGVLAGAALGLAGAVMQGVTRNPLADPGILGVNAGAALFVVAGIDIFGITALTGYVWFGLVGAALAACLVYAVSSLGRGGATPIKLALSGAAVSAALTSLITAILLIDADAFDQFRFWRVGSLAGRDGAVIRQALPFLAVGAVLALASGRMLNALALGEDTARSLGQHVNRGRMLAALSVVLLCGAATAMCGPIAFIGLTVPHLARLITGPDYRWILPYSMLLAPFLLLVADIVGRLAVRPSELQVGLMTPVIGAPVFVLLVRGRKLAEL
ncbi:iron chelate uptake ABC transporter family permease subunit [Streptomyces ferralitis]|uniref:Iron chelate uptake ABC transporter family permease subunit n=1 Tax=Streptantibioticus ferralitis TaxID=236510 RepID=A0ABT5ZBQ8_9ACTN|nr:iron chelate uptake ABC transporter family permease subunit [Streptantibioticus ferralitis]MDF2261284.1 iron chelate uptake ABC transporter family permease subunit [Streptantibioticus ferralitis]